MFNNTQPLVHNMPDRTHGTYAETKAEIEARNRAAIAAAEAMQQATEANKPKKTPWGTILTIVFIFIALIAAGFAVYEYSENTKLKTDLDKTKSSLNSTAISLEELQESYSKLQKSYEALEKKLKSNEKDTENTEATDSKTDTKEPGSEEPEPATEPTEEPQQ